MPCLSPITKPNPWYGNTSKLAFLHDTKSHTIGIPCGWCDNCVSVRQMYFVQRVQMEAQYNHLFMFTLTYNNEHLPILSVGDYDIPYGDISHLQDMLKRFRDWNVISRPWRYVAVSEFGGLRGRPHFHGLLMLPKYDSDTYNTCLSLQSELYDLFKNNWAINVGSKRVPRYEPLFTYQRRIVYGKPKCNFDLHYVIPGLTKSGVSDAAFYVLKYMLKDSDRSTRLQQALRLNYSDGDYQRIWSIVKPKKIASKGFGLNARRIDATRYEFDDRIIKYLHDGVQQTPSGSPYPFFFSPDSILTFPLAPYYRKLPKVFDLMDAMSLFYFSQDDFEVKPSWQIVQQMDNFKRKLELVQTPDFLDYFD